MNLNLTKLELGKKLYKKIEAIDDNGDQTLENSVQSVLKKHGVSHKEMQVVIDLLDEYKAIHQFYTVAAVTEILSELFELEDQP